MTRSLQKGAADELSRDPWFMYMQQCFQHFELILPVLAKMHRGVLQLDNYGLQMGHCRGIWSSSSLDPTIFKGAILNRNSLDDEQMATLIEGFLLQRDFKRLCISHNNFGPKSQINLDKILSKNIPFHLQELRIAHCQLRPDISHKLLEALNERSYLKSLSLIQMPFQDKDTFDLLCSYINHSKHLEKIDLSYNSFSQVQGAVPKLLKSLARNTNLNDINLSWNQLVPVPPRYDPDDEDPAKDVGKKAKPKKVPKNQPKEKGILITTKKVMKYLSKLIRRNQRLQHLNLTRVGLNKEQVLELGRLIFESRGLVGVHLCQNVITEDDKIEVFSKLQEMIKGKQQTGGDEQPVEDQGIKGAFNQRVKNYSAIKGGLIKDTKSRNPSRFHKSDELSRQSRSISSESQEALLSPTRHQDTIITRQINERRYIELKNIGPTIPPEQEILQQQVADSLENTDQILDPKSRLVLSRVVGQHCNIKTYLDDLQQQQWRVGNTKEHECWVCNHHRFSILLWSKCHCQIQQNLDTIDEDEYYQGKAEELFQAWKQAQPQLSREELATAQQKYGKDADGFERERVMVSGTFNGWAPQRMIRLTELLHEMDFDKPQIIDVMKQQGLIDRSETEVTEYSHLTSYQKNQYQMVEAEIYKQRRENWPILFAQSLRYNYPAIVAPEIIQNLSSIANIQDIYISFAWLPPGKSNYVVRFVPDTQDKDIGVEDKWCFPSKAPKARKKKQPLKTNERNKNMMIIDETEKNKNNVPSYSNYSEFDSDSDLDDYQGREQLYHQRAFIDVRSESIPEHDFWSSLHVDIQDNKRKKPKPFDRGSSVFREHSDLDALVNLSQCAQFDKTQLRKTIEGIYKEWPRDVDSFDRVFQSRYPFLSYLFYVLQTRITDSDQYPYLYRDDILNLCEMTGLMNGLLVKYIVPDKTQKIKNEQKVFDENLDEHQQAIVVFNDILFKVKKSGKFLRHNLVDIIIRLITHRVRQENSNQHEYSDKSPKPSEDQSYRNQKLSVSYYLEEFMNQNLIPATNILERFPRSWRRLELYSKDIHQIYMINEQPLSQLYRALQSGQKRNLNLQNAIKLLRNDGPRPIGVSEQQIVGCFAACKNCVPNEIIDQDTYSRIGYGELLELIARVSVEKFYKTDLEGIPLRQKILHILDDLFESIGIQSQDPSRPLHQSQLFKSSEIDANGEPLQVQHPEFLRAFGHKKRQQEELQMKKELDESKLDKKSQKSKAQKQPPKAKKKFVMVQDTRRNAQGKPFSYLFCKDDEESSSATSTESNQNLFTAIKSVETVNSEISSEI